MCSRAANNIKKEAGNPKQDAANNTKQGKNASVHALRKLGIRTTEACSTSGGIKCTHEEHDQCNEQKKDGTGVHK